MPRLGAVCLLNLCTAACTPLLPSGGRGRALVLDMERIVDAKADLGWMLDELEVQNLLPDAMASACRVPVATRKQAINWLDEQIAALGGPVEQAYVQRGGDINAVSELLLLSRSRLLLATAQRWADEGKCPFWLSPDTSFTGMQGFAHKLILSLETGARFYAQMEGNKPGFGGGGTLRLLSGFGLNDRWSLLAGIEAGGAARFTDVTIGRRAQVPAVLVFGAIPLVARTHLLSNHVELDTGPVAYFNQLHGRLQAGVRIGAGIGVSRLRLRGLVPGVTLSVSYDYIPAQSGLPPVHQLGGGLRAALSATP